MIVRTYGRRNRGLTRTFSDSLDDDVSDSPPLSQETAPSQDIYSFPFTSQESSSFWPSSQEFNDDVYKNQVTTHRTTSNFDFDDSRNGVVRRSKKQKKNQSKTEVGYSSMPWISSTSTLMEAQEFGEMMEHVDEVNFALDGLKKGQPVRIRRASFLSLLSICGTAQQRRLLRTHGMAKTIIDAILGLNFDDTPSNLAAVALFYVLTSDGQDEHLLESPSCIRFLIKLLKPVIPTAKENKTGKVGSKLLALRKGADMSRDTTKMLDSSSAAIISKVEEILVSCKEMKSRHGDDSGLRRPELIPKWIALLTLEKACLSKISLEDTTGTVRKTGGNFKEKLRELGGLDAVFEVAMECHSVMEVRVKQSLPSPHIEDKKDVQSLVLLSKCLKIMENAAFLSSDNQSHLLEMKGQLNSDGCRLSFTRLVISVIKILSGLYLKSSSASSSTERAFSNSKARVDTDELALAADCKVGRHDVISVNSSEKFSSLEWSFSEKSFNISQSDPGPSTHCLGRSVSSFRSTPTSTNDSYLLKMRIHSSLSSSSSGKLGSSDDGIPVTSNGSGTLCERPDDTKAGKWQLLEDSQDPYAFGEDDFVPSKWDLLSRKQKIPRTKKHEKLGLRNGEIQDEHQFQFTISQQESSNGEICQTEFTNEEYRHSNATSGSQSAEEEYSSLLSDCLLAAVKVLMNLTNDNPLGCQQIAASGALETLSTLIASHFPSFCSYLPRVSEMEENSLSLELHDRNDRPLTDPELDFLVAILGLLVNLVEKDEHNRSRLAAASVFVPNSEGLAEKSQMAVIPLLCAIFLANQGEDDAAGEVLPWNDEAAVLQEEKEAEKMILEAYAALLLAFLSTESKSTRNAIADCLPNHSLAILVPVLERFVAFHFTLNMISPETHKAVVEVIESCRIP
ncbi:WAPL protein, putative isoform 1 [Theobroma cacao]|uniref:WAPL protein, putative isoform 1 n=1 Tax=Theobroma cacao TaxID=3641 RepID=A0A061GFG5_THECC|nr:WAPL protein, putative isoform 1 [Theobroma cacao]EOY28306.1 WAPL protein, putative isoform 1 [Theobroma cacao]